MAFFTELYRRHENKQAEVSLIEQILKPHQETFSATLDEKGIYLGNNTSIFIPYTNVCGIEEDKENIYLILATCIHILCKENGRTKVNLR